MKKSYSTSRMRAGLCGLLALATALPATAGAGREQGVLDRKLTLSVEHEAFRGVLEKISRKADVKFSYTRNTLPEKEKVSVKAKEQALSKVFDELFLPYNINYEAIGSQIVLKRSRIGAMAGGMEEMDETIAAAMAFKKITGFVRDAVTNAAIPGVTVMVKGSNKGTSTNGDGHFELDANEGDVLTFSAIGFKIREVTVSGENSYNISLETDEKGLSEVVVTALGVKRSPRSLGYAVQNVKGGEITIAQAPTIAQGLMGKVAGLQISQASGGVEGGSSRV